MTTTTTRQAIAASLDVIKELGIRDSGLGIRNTELGEAAPSGTEQGNDGLIPNPESLIPVSTVAVMHLGHPSDAKYGQVEYLTEAEYERFVWAHTWPRPKGVSG